MIVHADVLEFRVRPNTVKDAALARQDGFKLCLSFGLDFWFWNVLYFNYAVVTMVLFQRIGNSFHKRSVDRIFVRALADDLVYMGPEFAGARRCTYNLCVRFHGCVLVFYFVERVF